MTMRASSGGFVVSVVGGRQSGRRSRMRSFVGALVPRRLLRFAALVGIAQGVPAIAQLPAWSKAWDWSAQLDEEFTVPPGCEGPGGEIAHAALLPVGLHRGKVLLWQANITNSTTQAWLFDPASPTKLVKIEELCPSEVFCSGFSFDPQGRIVLAGGINALSGSSVPHETFRFRAMQLGPVTTDACDNPIIVSGVPGGPTAVWKQLGNARLQRYYPGMLTLRKTQFQMALSCNQTILGGAQFLFGGAPNGIGGSAAGPTEGSEIWEIMSPNATQWACPLLPFGMPAANPPNNHYNATTMATNEQYAVVPSGGVPPHERLDSYPRAFQVSTGQIFIANDVNSHICYASEFNAPGLSFVIKPTYIGAPGWEYHGAPSESAITGVPADFDRNFGGAVLMHMQNGPFPALDRVLVFGGLRATTPYSPAPWPPALTSLMWTVNNEVREFTPGPVASGGATAGTWQTVSLQAGMTLEPREFLNAVVLPDGTIFLHGGSRTGYQQVGGCNGTQVSPVYAPEIFNPGRTPGAPASVALAPTPPPIPPSGLPHARLYHHVATLLPDGSVLVAGGEEGAPGMPANAPNPAYSGQVFYPNYMRQGFRPSFVNPVQAQVTQSTATTQITFPIDVATTFGRIERVVALRPAAVTHHFDTDQRYIELNFSDPIGAVWPGTNTLTVGAVREDLGPPGYYLVFVLEGNQLVNPTMLIPSVAAFVQFN